MAALLSDHALQKMRGHDDRLPSGQALFYDAPLNDGHLFVRAFDAQVAARNHDAVGFLNNFIKVGECDIFKLNIVGAVAAFVQNLRLSRGRCAKSL